MHQYFRRSIILAGFAAMMACSPQSMAGTKQIDGKFDIGGRSIRLTCLGTSGPTVIVDAGLGTAPVEDRAWQGIAAKVAPLARICLLDRAGLGGSDPAFKALRTSADAADDLERATRAAGLNPPFVIVGHSIGGLNAQVFASRHAEDVAALVLVSSTHPDQMRRWRALLPPAKPDDPKPLAAARDFLTTMEHDPSKNPEKLDLLTSEVQARKLGSLGDKPVMVLTQSPTWRMVPGLAEPLAVKLEDESQRMQKEFLRFSSNARQWIALRAGHHLPDEDPALVVAGISEAVIAVRNQKPEASH
jgi:pimeloyl-ACP methyl ester carboxylesterase